MNEIVRNNKGVVIQNQVKCLLIVKALNGANIGTNDGNLRCSVGDPSGQKRFLVAVCPTVLIILTLLILQQIKILNVSNTNMDLVAALLFWIHQSSSCNHSR